MCVVGNTDDTPDEIHDWLVEKGKKESGDSSGKADLTKVSKKSSEKKSANGSAEGLAIGNIKDLKIKLINGIFKILENETIGELIFNSKR